MGPLTGIRVIELVGIGPGPFTGMMMADMGAEVIAVDRIPANKLSHDMARRGKKSIQLNLKSEEGKAALLKLCDNADALIEGYRPGVMEKLGLGPDVLHARNPKLTYGRMTGWGQTGPLASAAGHDINYIALSGALHTMGPKGAPPAIPLNLIGDIGGGGMVLAFGLVCGIMEARASGKGQVIDANMVEGVSLMMTAIQSMMLSGIWQGGRGENLLDGGAHFYNTYETSDGKYVSLGAIEPQFMELFIQKTGLDESWMTHHINSDKWPELKEKLAELFKTKTQAEWCDLLEGTDACFAGVLPLEDLPEHPHHKARGSFETINGVQNPIPTPRFSRTPGKIKSGPVAPGADTDVILKGLGYSEADISRMKSQNETR